MIGLVVLGHSPRKDHEAVYDAIAPEIPRKLIGGLDGLNLQQARNLEDKAGVSPLVCLLSDGSTVEIPLPTLFPYLKEKVEELADDGASLAVILCCGGFPQFDCSIPVLLPGLVVPSVVSGLYHGKKIGLIVPNIAQEHAAQKHWKEKGVEVVSTVVSPYEDKGFKEAGLLFSSLGCDLVVIDCMGFTEEHRAQLQTLCGCSVLLPKTLITRVAMEIYESSQN